MKPFNTIAFLTGTLYVFSLVLIMIYNPLNAQELTQTVTGRIIDKISQGPLPGASIAAIKDSSILAGATADMNGYFKLEKIPVGRQTFKVIFVGYTAITLAEVIVSSGKELVLNIEMEESVVQMKTFEVTTTDKAGAINEMASGSVRTFNTEETERYAGSRGDPARMASNFAGVQGSDDSRNDVVIRGNSPIGLLWRIDGVNIPNPNHFATPGTTGGPVSMLNDKTLATSDFYTGAFPAEYGNSIAGVFDLKMRNGNSEKNEFTAQFGFLGTEILAEGPINKTDHSSYLISFRYSSLELFSKMNIKIGTDAIPNYLDGAFKLNFPTKLGTFAIFGIGGKSNIDIIVSKDTTPTQQLYGDQNRDQYFATNMATIGVSHIYQINASSYTHLTIATSIANTNAQDLLVKRDSGSYRVASINPVLGYNFTEQKVSLSFTYSKKYSAKNSMKLGIYADEYFENLLDTNYNLVTNHWDNREDYKGSTYLLQPFIQWQYKPTDDLTFNAGIHGMYFQESNSKSIEPRAGVKYNLTKRQTLGLSFGNHSELQPTYLYFQHIYTRDSNYSMHNKNMDFSRSNHLVLSYDVLLKGNLHIKAETYYQYLYNIPVTSYASSYSLLNEGTDYNRFFPDSLVNKGTGTNYGIELTIEKFFSNSFFYMFTGSLYNSRYKGSDGIERSTDFNGNFATNLLVGKEYKLGKKKLSVLNIGAKITYAGGHLYSPVNVDSSNIIKQEVIIDSLRNTERFHDYFRADIKIGLRFNRKKVAHEIGLDLVNVFNTKNVLSLIYAPNPLTPAAYPMIQEYQLGFLPIFYYKIDF
jgi:hypothetical protein